MADSQATGLHGETAIDDYLYRAVGQYRSHLELLYPFGVLGLLSLMVEIRLEVLELLFDFDNFRLRADRQFLEALVSDTLVEQLLPVLDEIVILLVAGLVLIALVSSLVFFVAVSIAFLVGADEYDNRDRRQLARSRTAIGRLPALVAGALIAGLAVIAGTVLLVVPGIYLAVKFALAGPAIVIDGHGPVEGLRASWRAVSGQFFTVFGVIVLGGLLLVGVGLLPIVGELLVVFGLLPILSLALAALYLDAPSRGA